MGALVYKQGYHRCLLKTLMPCPSTGPKMFNAGPTLLSWSKNSIAFSAF
jgi:hypothetical protein